MDELVPNPDGCPRFEPNPFKKEKCKHCGRLWMEHKGIITEAQVQVYVQAKRKVEEEKKAKEAVAQAKARAKLLAKKKQNQAAEDDWLFDGNVEEDTSKQGDSDDDLGFKMFVPTRTTSPGDALVKKELKVTNLIDFSECDVADAAEDAAEAAEERLEASSSSALPAVSSAPEVSLASGSPSNYRAPSTDAIPAAGSSSPWDAPPALPGLVQEEELLTEIAHLRQMLADANEEKNIQVAIVQEDVEKKQHIINGLRNQHQELQASLQESREQIGVLQAQTASTSTEAALEQESMRRKLEELQCEVTNLQSQRDVAVQERDVARKEHSDISTSTAVVVQQSDEVKSQLAALTNERNSLARERDAAVSECAAAIRERDAAMKAMRGPDNADDSQAGLEQAKRQLDDLARLYEAATKELDAAVRERDAAVKAFQDVNSKIPHQNLDHEAVIGEMQVRVEELLQKNDDLCHHRDELTRKGENLASQLRELTRERDELTRERDELIRAREIPQQQPPRANEKASAPQDLTSFLMRNVSQVSEKTPPKTELEVLEAPVSMKANSHVPDAQVEELTHQRDKLADELLKARKELDSIKTEQEFSRELANLSTEQELCDKLSHDALVGERDASLRERDTATADLHKVQENLERERAAADKLRKEVEAHRARAEGCQADIDSLQAEVKRLRDDVAASAVVPQSSSAPIGNVDPEALQVTTATASQVRELQKLCLHVQSIMLEEAHGAEEDPQAPEVRAAAGDLEADLRHLQELHLALLSTARQTIAERRDLGSKLRDAEEALSGAGLSTTMPSAQRQPAFGQGLSHSHKHSSGEAAVSRHAAQVVKEIRLNAEQQLAWITKRMRMTAPVDLSGPAGMPHVDTVGGGC